MLAANAEDTVIILILHTCSPIFHD